MAKVRHFTALNRSGWNAIAASRSPQPPEFFASGGSTLDDCEVAALGDVTGKRLLHLQCANGNESLSLARLGAHVVGVDISEVAVTVATAQAEATGLDAQFVVADVYDLPDDLGDFDVVYASAGVVCWLPDLVRWGGIVAGLLRLGAAFVLYEHHPLWETLAVGTSGVAVTVDYFGRGSPVTSGYAAAKRPVGWTTGTDFVTFVWPVADVVTALIHAGLRIGLMEEHAVPEMFEGLGAEASYLPATYLIRATKE